MRTAFNEGFPIYSFGPKFIAPVENQTAAIGREVTFSCSVSNIGKFKVGWLRASDKMIISLHTKTVIQNDRIAIKYEPIFIPKKKLVSNNYSVNEDSQKSNDVVNGTWRLIIRQLKETDRGCYMCQINTSPMISQLGCLDILDGINFIPVPIFNSSNLELYRIDRKQMGTYLCIASNDVHPAVSKRVTLSVNFLPNIQALNQLLGAPLGTDVILECNVEAYPNTVNYWFKNPNGMLLDGSKYSIEEKRDGYKVAMRLTIKRFHKEDIGSYSCISSNSLGKVEGISRLYKIGEFDGHSLMHESHHISILAGLAEAARDSDTKSSISLNSSVRCFKSYNYTLLLILLRNYFSER
ncbi:PREDICTED: lachesin isoform X2 [Ceratosolen solmsi marchali]|uniref:Lachesin isoform X2 n=1 Tax=Ceratosolen solmsi marchali TaxID=326594 RepID=A0AAJ6YTD3_9HYME|nr:PREDICTED: lachesin isoform X2 [Ceratosolen solmsi marchali]